MGRRRMLRLLGIGAATAGLAACGTVPLPLELVIQDLAGGGAAFEGVAVYVWHCDRKGRLDSDNVFGDGGGALQLATVTGDVSNGYTVTLSVRVRAAGRGLLFAQSGICAMKGR